MRIPLHALFSCAVIIVVAAPLETADGQDCGLEDPELARTAPPVPSKPREGRAPWSRPAVRRLDDRALFSPGQGLGGGALAGKTVYVSAGHGWYTSSNGWRTQRGNTHGLVEDFISAETASYFLVQYLRNMGAYVVTVRESDPNPNLSIIDDADSGFAVEGDLVLQADGEGFGSLPLPLEGDVNPFESGTARVADANDSVAGAAVWTFDVPESGEYNVYVGYRQDPSRAPDAHYEVRHAGGSTDFHVDQRRHGGTWVTLGRFYFEAGQSADRGALVLHNDAAAGTTLSFDVARIGGGRGLMDRGAGASGFPRFEEAARYHVQFAGAPLSVYEYTSSEGRDDIGARSRFAAWDHPDGEDAVYIAWHTNAPSPARGTVSFAYGPKAYGSISEFTGVGGSLELLQAVHGELVGDIHAVWDPDWYDRGPKTAYFGEINPSHNPEIPSALFEVAFHSTAEDADALRAPAFRRLAARAMAQGVARYFAARDDVPLVLPSEPPRQVRVQQAGDGDLRVSFAAPLLDDAAGDPPTSYRVYSSRDGYSFDNGIEVSGTELIFGDVGDEPMYFRVTSINAGGESMPSAVVGARATTGDRGQILIVQGFDRLDEHMLPSQDLSSHGIGVVQRGLIDRMNHRSYVAPIARAIDASGISFESANADALQAGAIDLDDYSAVFWALGEEVAVFDQDDVSMLLDYLAGGGMLVLSGTEFSRVHHEAGSTDLLDGLGIAYVSDDGDTYDVSASSEWADLGSFAFDDHAFAAYDAEAPDVIRPSADGRELLSYLGGHGGAAAVWHETPAGGAALTLAFPFEVVAGAEARSRLMARIVKQLELRPDPLTDPPDDDSNDPEEEEEEEETPPAAGCGCQTRTAEGGSWLSLVLLALFLLRSRRRSIVERDSPAEARP